MPTIKQKSTKIEIPPNNTKKLIRKELIFEYPNLNVLYNLFKLKLQVIHVL
jgi:hypothetical protein